MSQGNVVLLNGTSSAGKSTIAKALQETMETPWLHTGIDHFLAGLPPRCFVVSDGIDPATAPYFLLVYKGGAAQIVDDRGDGASVYGSGRLTEVRIGPRGIELLTGMYRAIAAFAAAGIDVIVDDVIHDRLVLAAAVSALRETPVLFVGLHLSLEIAERRERERGDRGPGGAAAFSDLVHAHGVYDLELDTAALSPEECAQRIKHAIQGALPRRGFRVLADALGG